MTEPYKPSKEEVLDAAGRSVPDVIAPGLRVLFCGINPGLYTAAVGHHFARPGNRFWPSLFHAGITERLLSPFEERELLGRGFGITNIVNRGTAKASELTAEELRAGGAELVEKIGRFQPCFVAFLGVGAYRSAFSRPKASLGLQDAPMAGAKVWVLPNPSGINAHYSMEALARMLKELKAAADAAC